MVSKQVQSAVCTLYLVGRCTLIETRRLLGGGLCVLGARPSVCHLVGRSTTGRCRSLLHGHILFFGR